jgi:hypothetical protein
VGALVAACLLPACSGGGAEGAGACRPVERPQAQFPASHLLPGQPEPRYLSEPPTSGPHIAVLTPPTVATEPISRPEQVGLLEAGRVLVQYLPGELDDAQVASLAALAGPEVVVAPDPDLDDPVVLTAWLRLQRCSAADTDAITAFVDEHADLAPGGHVGS